ncbi:HNH endonuclease family protein [Corynebacterium halotolerans]|uniref:GmrSD restriction endonucleases C-terminal domain-containing protein n=1 Tax=Corynebacterium halotolerans YIM 70093 = DSM 44683 TaxID=1121362 RepID=M1NLL0_9CORY|nr:HNH endonuclease family protein [Corynebacterium halotolerans]AGF72293.1 hypothetical protein A605_06435 [Corynebacterium halotolerans YIM 70093 = DSM 44683]
MRKSPPGTPVRLLTGIAAVLSLALGATACTQEFGSGGVADSVTETATATGSTAPAPPGEPGSTPSTSAQGDAPRAAGEYHQLLASLPVKGRAPMTGYDRDLFGQAWTDDVDVEFGRNGCDTRNDILRRDFETVQIRPGTQGCLVESGTIIDPYSGGEIEFTRGRGTSSDVQIDHVVALADAWAKGARALDERTRQNLANDPDNLLAVDGGLNAQKGAGDAATWLPPNRAFRCTYAQRQITVKARYDLWVTAAERDALERQLNTCP